MSSEAEKAAIDAANAFMDAFNAQDHEALAATLNYPHVRLATGRFMTVDSHDDFVKMARGNRKHLEAEGWHHTVNTHLSVVHSGEDKVHLSLAHDRCHEDGTCYLTFDTLWIATLQDGHWGIQFRSSYLRPLAPR